MTAQRRPFGDRRLIDYGAPHTLWIASGLPSRVTKPFDGRRLSRTDSRYAISTDKQPPYDRERFASHVHDRRVSVTRRTHSSRLPLRDFRDVSPPFRVQPVRYAWL